MSELGGGDRERKKRKESKDSQGSARSSRSRSASKRDSARRASEGPLVLVDAAHGNDVTLSKGGRHLARSLGGRHCLQPLRDSAFTEEILLSRDHPISAVLIAGPSSPFAQAELDALSAFISRGGGLLALLGEGKDRDLLDPLLSSCGIRSARDCALRVSPAHGCSHPKEAVLENCCLNRAIESVNTIAYPRGCTLITERPAVPIASSGNLAYPAHRPIAAVSRRRNVRCDVAVLGSSEAAHDKWVAQGDNRELLQFLMSWVCPPSPKEGPQELHQVDADDPEISDPGPVPDTVSLAERPRCSLQEAKRLPVDFTSLFDTQLAELDLGMVGNTSALHEELGIERKGLNLIAPQLETPLPPLQPATFPPQPKELEAPPLELLDLDASLQDEKTRLAEVMGRCKSGSEQEVVYMVKECSKALGVGRPATDSPKHLLAMAFQRIAMNKCSGTAQHGKG